MHLASKMAAGRVPTTDHHRAFIGSLLFSGASTRRITAEITRYLNLHKTYGRDFLMTRRVVGLQRMPYVRELDDRVIALLNGSHVRGRTLARRALTFATVMLMSSATAAFGQGQASAPAPAPAHEPAPQNGPGQLPAAVRIESVAPIVVRSDPAQGTSLKDWASALGGPLGLLGALAAVGMGMRNTKLSIESGQRNADAALAVAQRTNEANLWQKANETELRDIQAKLDGFYGPFMQMSGANRLLAQELSDRQPDRGTHRLIAKVFDKAWLDQLSTGDRTIVREVCQNAVMLETFIRDKAAMVGDQLLPYLSRASAHYRILNLAYKGELGTDPANFLIYLFPYQLANVLELEVDRLRRRCAQIRAAPYVSLEPIPPLVIPEGREYRLPPWPSPPRFALENERAASTMGVSEAGATSPNRPT
jgi:hypothetical protein